MLEPDFLSRLLFQVARQNLPPHRVRAQLRECAERLVGPLVKRELVAFANHEVVSQLDIDVAPTRGSMAAAMVEKIGKTPGKMEALVRRLTEGSALVRLEQKATERYLRHLNGDAWVREFPGRDILRAFIRDQLPGQNYDYAVNLLIGLMADSSFRPKGMERVLARVRSA